MTVASRSVNALLLVSGTVVAAVVTRRIHERRAGFWATRLGPTRLRRGDLPVGASVVLASTVLLSEERRGGARAAAAGLALGTLATAFADPLPQAAVDSI